MKKIVLIKTYVEEKDDWDYIVDYEDKTLNPNGTPLLRITRENRYKGYDITCYNQNVKDDDITFEAKAIKYFDIYAEKQRLLYSKTPRVIKTADV